MAKTGALIKSSWNSKQAAKLGEPELLRYRSNLLGADKRITNFSGGNTSSKLERPDPLSGGKCLTLWVKGSGGDLGSMGLDGFTVLEMDKLLQLKQRYRGPRHEDEQVGYLPLCAFGINTKAASIDTPLHAYVPHSRVDHVHPDAVIAIAAATNSEEVTKRAYGDRIGWQPWRRPGFKLSLWLEKFVRENPQADSVVLGSHGLFTWAADDESCYRNTLWAINQAIRHLATATDKKSSFGRIVKPRPAADRQAIAARLMPRIRGQLLGGNPYKAGNFSASPEVLEFVSSSRLTELAKLGTSCPDHFLRTKIRPLVLPRATLQDTPAAQAALGKACAAYRKYYAAYHARHKRKDSSAMRDPNPVIFLLEGVGMVTFAANKATARIAAEFYSNAINVMRGAEGVGKYFGLSKREAFNIEYWQLEEAKLRRLPPPAQLTKQVALVTGAAGGIGSASRLLAEGACVVFIASKNGLAASPNATAYCTAKVAKIHLARCLALEGGDRGIRVNVVNPDAVIQSSRIWSSSWKEERAHTYGIKTTELEEHYRKHNLLKRSVYPADFAAAVLFLTGPGAAKSTGNVINVDAGNLASFPH